MAWPLLSRPENTDRAVVSTETDPGTSRGEGATFPGAEGATFAAGRGRYLPRGRGRHLPRSVGYGEVLVLVERSLVCRAVGSSWEQVGGRIINALKACVHIHLGNM